MSSVCLSDGLATIHTQALHAAALLVLAGADVDRIVELADRARDRSRDGYQRR